MFRALYVGDSNGSLCDLLVQLGATVSVTETSESGIDNLKQSQYDIVLADLCVEKAGARGVARWVKSYSPDTKFFVVTGWQGELEKELLKMDGIHDIIRKPFIFNEIRDKIYRHLL